MNKEIFKTLNKEQMIVAFSQLKDDYHNLFKQHEKITRKYKKFKKDIVSKIMIWEKEELPDNEDIIEMIDTLMSEVSRLEYIEDKKVEVAVNFIEEKRDKEWKDKIREIINKYIDIQEHLEYINQELYGEDLKNMIKELLEEK